VIDPRIVLQLRDQPQGNDFPVWTKVVGRVLLFAGLAVGIGLVVFFWGY
jgi:hypothetical protein